jgi:hypothetical protein
MLKTYTRLGRSLWQVSILVSCSWSWKKILKLQDLAKRFIWFKVGDGSNVFLWLDQWYPAGYLLDMYGFRIVYDSGLPLKAKLAAIINDGDWFWTSAWSDALIEIQSQLHEVVLGDVDLPIWDSKNGKYSCPDTWGKLREVHPIVNRWRLVWFPTVIPIHSLLWIYSFL